MEILGIGPLELILILIVALIVMGPNDMAKAGRTLGRTLRKITTSESWQVILRFMKEMQTMPNKLMREAQFDELVDDVNKELKQPLADIKAVTADTTKTLSSLSAWSNPNVADEPETVDLEEDDGIEQRTIAPPADPGEQHSDSLENSSPDNTDLTHA